MSKNKYLFLAVFLTIFISFISCDNSFSYIVPPPKSKYLTKNVIVVVIDGPRYSETWGDTTHQNIPHLAEIFSTHGIISTKFYNDGVTTTTPGHTAITTGHYQKIDNSGLELPIYPSIFQLRNEQYVVRKESSWIVTSKDKLEVLANCNFPLYKNKLNPLTDCGKNGNGTGYRDDTTTYHTLIDILEEHHPNLALVNFKGPDAAGHDGDWDQYIHHIKSTDALTSKIWDYLQADSNYIEKTTLFVTNDHGRHLDSIADGFISHGDSCMGCKHITLFASGPDFKKGEIINIQRSLIDINATAAELLNVENPYGKGNVMHELFK